MSKLRLILIVGTLAFYFCFIYACGGDEKECNIYDPNNEEYIEPKLKITEPKNGESDVTFTLEVDDSLKDYCNNNSQVESDKLEYRYSLNEQDRSGWIRLSEQNEIKLNYNYLDEGGYTLKWDAKYFGRDEKEAVSQVDVSFVVDAVKGPALMFDKRYVKLDQGQDFDIRIMAEEIEEQRRMILAHIVLSYDPKAIEILQVIEQKDLEKNGGKIMFIPPDLSGNSSKSGEIEINVGIGGGNPIGVDGTCPIARLTFKALKPGKTELKIDSTSKIRDKNNSDIILKDRVNSTIEIK